MSHPRSPRDLSGTNIGAVWIGSRLSFCFRCRVTCRTAQIDRWQEQLGSKQYVSMR